MFPRWPIILAACASLAAFASGAARAGTAIRLQTAGDLPFTAEELEQAVGARVAMSADSGAALVTVRPVADAGVQLRMGDRQTIVAVGGHAGRAAARVVALAIAELAADALAEDEEENDDEEPDVRRAPPETGPPSIAAAAAPLPAASASTRISVAFGTLKGYRDVQPFNLTGEADVAVPRNGFDLIGGVGVWDQPTRRVGQPDELSLLAGVVRAGVGWRTGPAQLVVGAFLAPYRIEGPAIHHTGALAGAGAMVRVGYRFAVLSNIEVFGSLRIDAFANQVRLMTPGEYPSFETPRLAAAAAIGAAWDLGI